MCKPCYRVHGSEPVPPQAKLPKHGMPQFCENLGGCEMNSVVECYRCNRWLCERCSMDGPPPACIICPAIELRERRLFGMSLKVVDAEITEAQVLAAKVKADTATHVAGIGQSRAHGYGRRPMSAPEATSRNRMQ